MGVKVTVTKQELYPVQQYLLRVKSNELVKDRPNKVKIRFTIADGPYNGREVNRNFNNTLSSSSELGKLVGACGIDVDSLSLQGGFDLDNINGSVIMATLTHYTNPQTQGTINSLQNFVRVQGGAVPHNPVPQPQSGPIPQYTPPQGNTNPTPQYVPPANGQPAPQYVPPTNAPKINF